MSETNLHDVVTARWICSTILAALLMFTGLIGGCMIEDHAWRTSMRDAGYVQQQVPSEDTVTKKKMTTIWIKK